MGQVQDMQRIRGNFMMRALCQRGYRFGLLGLFIILGFGLSSSSQASAKRKFLMAAVGDSLTAASFANTDLVSAGQGATVTGAIQNKATFSWASGTKIDSHFVELKKYIDKHFRGLASLEVINEAEPGSQAHRLVGQVERIAAKMKTGQYESLLYVTYMIGANDVCNTRWPEGVPNDVFKKNVVAGLAKLNEIVEQTRGNGGHKIKVLVPSIANVTEIGNPHLLDRKTMLGMTCDKLLNQVLNYCRKMSERWTNPDATRQKKNYIKDKNAILKAVVAEAGAQFPGLDLFYAQPVFEMELSAEILSADCFHPSINGQELVSKILWFEQPWFKE